METTKKSNRKAKSSGKDKIDKILKAYRQTLLTEGKRPSSVFTFCQSIDLAEDKFYGYYGSFDAIDKEIWKEYLATVSRQLDADSNYSTFSTREKILAFYFTLVETLRSDRSFVLLCLKDWKNPAMPPAFIKAFKADFEAWLVPVLNEGMQSGEIARRPGLDKQYDKMFWLHLMFIIQFWTKDDSAGFEKTDAAIEKSVNLAFDLISKGILDNAIDFGKFLFQNSKG